MCSIFPFRLVVPLLCLFSLQGPLCAQSDVADVAEALVNPAALSYREAIVGQGAMDLSALDSRVAGILRDYYAASFGGMETWEQIESFRFEGVLRLPQGALSFVAFKKKPDYCKVVLFGGNDVRIVMSYDGVDAWQLNTAESTEPSAMPPLEALNFIRDATTAGHLHYPSLPGKQVELLPTRLIDGRACYDLRVTLPNGQQVTYAIERLTFVELQQVVFNPVSGVTEVTTHGRHERVAGVMVPMESTMTIDGEFAHSIEMRSVEANCGLMPWMFARPSMAYAPGRGVTERVELDQPLGLGLTGETTTGLGESLPLAESFGLEEAPVSVFGPSRFPDLDAATKQSILDDIADQ